MFAPTTKLESRPRTSPTYSVRLSFETAIELMATLSLNESSLSKISCLLHLKPVTGQRVFLVSYTLGNCIGSH